MISLRELLFILLLAMMTNEQVTAYTESEVLEFYKKVIQGQSDSSNGTFCSTEYVSQFEAGEWVDVILEKSITDQGVLTQKEAKPSKVILNLAELQLCDMTKNLVCVFNYTQLDDSKSEFCTTCTPDGFPEGKEKRYCETVAKVVGFNGGDPKIKVVAPTKEEAKKEAEEKMKKNGKNKKTSSGGERLTKQQHMSMFLAAVTVGGLVTFLLNLPQD